MTSDWPVSPTLARQSMSLSPRARHLDRRHGRARLMASAGAGGATRQHRGPHQQAPGHRSRTSSCLPSPACHHKPHGASGPASPPCHISCMPHKLTTLVFSQMPLYGYISSSKLCVQPMERSCAMPTCWASSDVFASQLSLSPPAQTTFSHSRTESQDSSPTAESQQDPCAILFNNALY